MIAAPPSSRRKRGQLETESFAGGGSARSDLCTMLMVTAGGGDVGTTFAVPAGRRTSVGRASECDVVLSDRSISRVHAYFTLGSGALILHDNDSRNGTFVNEARVDRAVPVEPGDSVRLGKVHLRVVVVEAHEAAAMLQLAAATRREEQRLRGHGSVDGTVVSAPAMRRLYEQAHRAAQSPISVLLLGETGVGKEVLARAIHGASPRAGKPFFALNCAALPESLLEAELFGHERGAFTGATGARVGLFEAASGGTVFLDEVGELSPAVQAKLLRVLDERKVTPLGGHATRAVDVRFVAATNRDLAKEAKQKAFREDLYFRLAGLTLTVPPLRQRKAEIPELAAFFLVRAAEMARRAPPRMTPEFVRGLSAHDWPGNVRELRNVIERAVVLAEGDELLPEHLGEELPRSSRRSQRGASLRKDLDSLEKQRILEALEQAEGNQTRAAELLGMPRRTLVYRLGTWGLTRPRK